jgi:sec-independent protein translocase protein TatC
VAKVFNPLKPIQGIVDLWSNDKPDDFSDDKEMTLLEHLEELRNRFLVAAVAIVVCTGIGMAFGFQAVSILKVPAPAGLNFVAIDVTETFVTYFKVAFLGGIGVSMPILVYQLVRFVAPAMTRKEKRLLVTIMPMIAFFFFAGVAFGYFITLRFALNFLLGFGIDLAQPTIRISNYISFVLTILFWMGISFELPVVLYVLAKLGVVTAKRLGSFRRYAILIAFIIAAIVTPTPDPLNQTLVAAPMIVLYEVGILMARTA